MMDYLNASEIFTELFFYFYKLLPMSDRLIISGYGFGDKAVNTNIVRWVKSAKHIGDRKILLIDPYYERLLNTARGAISNNLPEWERVGIITIARGENNKPLGIKEITLQTILDFISH
jgi:hypothetical protein